MSGLALLFQDDDFNYSTSLLLSSSTAARTPASTADDKPISSLFWEDWKHQRNACLHKYVTRRILATSDDDDHDDGGGAPKQPSSSQDEEDALETQQQSPPQPKGGGGGGGDPPTMMMIPKPPPRLPHVSQTTTTTIASAAEYWSDVDLLSGKVDLRLCRVVGFEKRRSLRRHALTSNRRCSSKKKRDEQDNNDATTSTNDKALLFPPSLQSFGDTQDDGPLQTVYKKNVMVLELEQITEHSKSELRRRAEHCQQAAAAQAVFAPDSPTTTFKVFLYNDYADKLADIFKKMKKNSTRFVSLTNIPPECIFPYNDDDEFCVCIGNESLISTIGNDNEKVFLCFDRRYYEDDSSSVEFQVAAEEEKGALITTWQIVGRTAKKDVLQSEYQQWQAYNSKQQRAATAPVEAAAAAAPVPAAAQAAKAAVGSPARERKNESPIERRRVEVAQEAGESTASNKKRKRQQNIDDEGPMQPRVLAAPGPYQKMVHLRDYYASHEILHGADFDDDEDGGGFGTRPPPPCMISLYGVVLGFRAPSRTRRGEWSVAVQLTDDSVLPLNTTIATSESQPLQSIHITIFSRKREDLPQLERAGDVMRLHRVQLQEYNGDVQLCGMRASSYLVVRPRNPSPSDAWTDDDWELLPTAKHEFAFTENDRDRIVQLNKWGQKRLLDHPIMHSSVGQHVYSLARMKRPRQQDEEENDNAAEGVDLTVMVTAILPLQAVPPQMAGVVPRGYLRVWDGTGISESDPAPPLTTTCSSAADPPRRALVRIKQILQQLVAKLQDEEPTDALDLERLQSPPPKVVVGRVANVAIWEAPHWELVSKSVAVGTFVRLRNVTDSPLPDKSLSSCLQVHQKSWLTPLPNLCCDVGLLLQAHQLRRSDPPNPNSGILPLEGHEQDGETNRTRATTRVGGHHQGQHKKQATASPFQRFMEGYPPGSYTGPVRVHGTLPSTNGDATGLTTVQDDGLRIYEFAVELEDASTGMKMSAVVQQRSSVGQVLLGMSAADAVKNPIVALGNLQTAYHKVWQATIVSIEYQRCKFFIVDALQPC